MRARTRAGRVVGAGCRIAAVGVVVSVVTVLTGSTFSVGVALVVVSLLLAHLRNRRP